MPWQPEWDSLFTNEELEGSVDLSYADLMHSFSNALGVGLPTQIDDKQ
jgi:hypothetical protein